MAEHKCKCAGCTKSAKQATELERERIIGFLENSKDELLKIIEQDVLKKKADNLINSVREVQRINNLIALIKGETND